MKKLALLLPWCALPALAQMPTEFPAEATAITAELFAERAAGKSFRGVRADGVDARMDFAKDGTVVMYSRGNSVRGTWRVDGDKLCTDLVRATATCNDVRLHGDVLFYKRVANNEVLKLTAN